MITDFIEMKVGKEKSNMESAVGSKNGKASGRAIKIGDGIRRFLDLPYITF